MSDFWFSVLKAIISIVVTVCSVLVTTYVIPWLKSKKNDAEYEQLSALVQAGVRAAEQVIKADGKGTEKKQRVTEFVSQWLMERGIQISEAQLSELIESAVYTMKQEQK